jgi:hypothetical protein
MFSGAEGPQIVIHHGFQVVTEALSLLHEAHYNYRILSQVRMVAASGVYGTGVVNHIY